MEPCGVHICLAKMSIINSGGGRVGGYIALAGSPLEPAVGSIRLDPLILLLLPHNTLLGVAGQLPPPIRSVLGVLPICCGAVRNTWRWSWVNRLAGVTLCGKVYTSFSPIIILIQPHLQPGRARTFGHLNLGRTWT